MSFEVVRPGVLTLLQDYGRFEQQHLGMSPGGPMDEHAFLWANHLLGNTPDAAALEITVGQLQLRSKVASVIALTGADMNATINGRALRPWCAHSIKPDDVLSLGTARTGLRAYLAVAGGFLVPAHYGSRATVVREGIGGLDRKGSPLKSGDLLPVAAAQSEFRRCVPTAFIPDYSLPLTLRVMSGYQHDVFSAAQLERLFSSEFQVTPQSDRMAYRLSGPAIEFEGGGIISEGISYGAIQIPPNGQPIIMLKDRQTIGGYPKIGCVASLDASKLAQRTAGAKLRFVPAELEEIIEERREFDQFFGLGEGNSSFSLR